VDVCKKRMTGALMMEVPHKIDNFAMNGYSFFWVMFCDRPPQNKFWGSDRESPLDFRSKATSVLVYLNM